MTLDEAIKDMEMIAEENQRVVDTGIVFDDVTIDMLYCDDTEVIDEHLANYQKALEEYRQIAEWLKELKRYKEAQVTDAVDRVTIKEHLDSFGKDTNVTTTDAVDRQAVNELVDELARAISDERCCISRGRSTATIMRDIRHLPSVTPQPKMGQWLIKRVRNNDHAICSVCGDDSFLSPEWDALELYKYCPNCGAKMQEVEE